MIAARAADDKKGDDVLVFDVGDTLAITDFFVIASGSNRRLVLSLADAVEEAVKRSAGISPMSVEGLDEASWVLLDFGSFCVHLLLTETRDYYDLERLWADAPTVAWRTHRLPDAEHSESTALVGSNESETQ